MKRRAIATIAATALALGGGLGACSVLVSPDDYVGTRPPSDGDDSGTADTGSVDAMLEDSSDDASALPGPLWLYYRFDGDTHDSSGNGRDGTLAGATSTLDAGGVIGTALSCVSAGDKVKIGDDFRPGSSSFTIALFYRVQMTDAGVAAHTYNAILVKGSAFEDSTNDAPGFGLGYNDGAQNVQGFIRDDVTTHDWVSTHAKASAALPLRDGKFHHVALVVDRDAASPRLSFYVDGSIRDFVNIPAGYGPVDSTDVAQICSEGTSNNPMVQMDGTIDEVMIFTRALSGPEVAALAARTHD
ncbi:MAG: LamG-like jellyroll fold domain-containing protein [Polyangiaceae bacterium]